MNFLIFFGVLLLGVIIVEILVIIIWRSSAHFDDGWVRLAKGQLRNKAGQWITKEGDVAND